MLSKILFSCWLIVVINSGLNAGSTIRIVQISDVQIGFTEARAREAGTITGNGMDSDYFARAVEMINNLKPKADIVVNTGDLVNDPSSMEQWNCFNSISQRLKPRLYEVMGNHDGWTTEGVKEFQNRFGEADY